jgi:hypothetical protein
MKMKGITFINALKARNVPKAKKVRDYKFSKPRKRDLKLIKPKPKKKWNDGWDVLLDARLEAAKNREEEAAKSRQRGSGPSTTVAGQTSAVAASGTTTVTTATATSTSGG